jgi:hypothetical protein
MQAAERDNLIPEEEEEEEEEESRDLMYLW